MLLLADIQLASETLAVVGAVVGSLSTAIVLLWRQQIKDRDCALKDCQEQRDLLLNLLIERGLVTQAFQTLHEHGHSLTPDK